MFDLLNQGKIVLINTAKDLLGQEGTAIFGRFFIALISQATQQRAAIPSHERRPTFVYIDEAQDYFDDGISNLLNQARKYRVGLIFSHQNLDQLGSGLRSSVLSSTTIKFAGGVSAKDARTLSSEFHCDADFLVNQKKGKASSEFACYIKNFTSAALTVSIPLGFVEGLPRISENRMSHLIGQNRERYSAPPLLVEHTLIPRSSETPQRAHSAHKIDHSDVHDVTPNVESIHDPRTSTPERSSPSYKQVPKTTPIKATGPGHGGRQHRYLQELVKHLAEERGFRASIEMPILEGSGRVDVSLEREELRVACQISVTTTTDWELSGVEKCLAAEYSHVALIGVSQRHIQRLSKFIEEHIDPSEQGKVAYLTSESLVEYLDDFGPSEPSRKTIRGYKVKTTHQGISAEDAAARRTAISKVIAQSLRKEKEGKAD